MPKPRENTTCDRHEAKIEALKDGLFDLRSAHQSLGAEWDAFYRREWVSHQMLLKDHEDRLRVVERHALKLAAQAAVIAALVGLAIPLIARLINP